MRYIVNHGGEIHSVADEDFQFHLGAASKRPTEDDPAGKPAREATPAEIRAYYRRQGIDYTPERAVLISNGNVWSDFAQAFVTPEEADRLKGEDAELAAEVADAKAGDKPKVKDAK
jgi:hypothetical protein